MKDATDFVFEDDSGLLKWLAADRAEVTFGDPGDIAAKLADVVGLINRWMEATSTPG